MRLLLVIAGLLTLALLATGSGAHRMRRSRALSMLRSGGWIAVAVGAALGPDGAGAITRETLQACTPLLEIAIGWVGLMLGLQLNKEVLGQLPGRCVRAALVDSGAVCILVGGAATIAGAAAFNTPDEGALVAAVGLVTAATIGWSMETRSLGIDAGAEGGHERTLFLRGGGALAAPIAAVVFGIAHIAADAIHTDGTLQAGPARTRLLVAQLFAVLLIAVVMGPLGRVAIRSAGQSRAELLAVFLGVVAFVAGTAAAMGVSPLFGAMLVGVVIANLGGPALRRFERFILEAEHVVAVLLAILAGAAAQFTGNAGEVLAIAGFIVVGRLVTKLLTVRIAAGGATRVYTGALRQSPLAIPMAVGAALFVDEPLRGAAITAVLVAGFVCELFAMAVGLWAERRGRNNNAEALA